MRRTHDDYPTPAWCVDRFIEGAIPRHLKAMKHANWAVEPSAGAGGLIRALKVRGIGMHWTGIEIQHCHEYELEEAAHSTIIGDYLERDWLWRRSDIIVGNPPYKLAEAFCRKAVSEAPFVAMLLRMGFLSSAKRSAWLRDHTPSVYVLPQRPSFTGDGRTDSYDYAWCVWDGGEPVVRILGLTAAAVRRGDPRADPGGLFG